MEVKVARLEFKNAGLVIPDVRRLADVTNFNAGVLVDAIEENNALSARLAKLEAQLSEKPVATASEMTDAEASTLLDTLDRRQNPLSSSFHNRSVIKSIRRPVANDALMKDLKLLRNECIQRDEIWMESKINEILKKRGGA